MRPARLGLLAALTTFALDQASKLVLLYGYVLTLHEPVRLLPVLDLVALWNRGISFSLFQQLSEVGRWVLVVAALAAAAALAVWMGRAATHLLALSLGLIIGGALGNAVDRAAYGAVFDWVHLHWGAWSWYVFNLADAAIVAGVAGLLYDSLVLERRRAAAETGAPAPDG